MANHHFLPADESDNVRSVGQCWTLSPEVGEGSYWIYAKKDLYDIKIHDFLFYEDCFLEFPMPECLSITQYESISGEELSPYRRLSAVQSTDPQADPHPFHRDRDHARLL